MYLHKCVLCRMEDSQLDLNKKRTKGKDIVSRVKVMTPHLVHNIYRNKTKSTYKKKKKKSRGNYICELKEKAALTKTPISNEGEKNH